MSIRTATLADLPRVVELGSRSLIDGPYAGIIADNPIQTARLAGYVFEKGTILLAEDDDGVVCGLLAFLTDNHHFSGELYSAEMIWYVLPEHRAGGIALKLLWEAERIAKAGGSKFMIFTAPNNPVGAVYKRFGYDPIETNYRKVF